MNNYALMLFNGDEISLNKAEAAKYNKMATDRCDEIAMLMYAKMLYIGDRIKANGNGIATNMKEAVCYFKIAINKGNTESMTYYTILIERNGCCKICQNQLI
ncbi:hypothetical protein M9Y10_019900 [Tritrichomonas musculus]|uniref:Sel1 repeat family protein n=1 Tax=Tritrichomonas musculus TaxID=1915356 RepID=A0ABR2HHN6_9EUKA